MPTKRWNSGEVLTNEDQNDLADRADQGIADAATAQAAADAAQADADASAKKASNLGDLASIATAITNLGFGTGGANIPALRTALGLVAVALSGAYADLSGKPTLSTVAGTGVYADLLLAPVEENDDTATAALEFIDPGMEVIARVSATGITAYGLTIRWDGTVTGTAITATSATHDSLLVASRLEIDANTATPARDLTDDGMEVLERIEADGTRTAHGTNTSLNDAPPAHEVLDEGMELLWGAYAHGIALPGLFVDRDDAGPGIAFIDEGMEVLWRPDTTAPSHTAAEIRARGEGNLASAAMMGVVRADRICKPVAAYNHAPVYGQSLGQGAEGTPPLSTTAKYDNLMLGNIAASVSNVMPGANNATPPTFQVTGSAVFNGLVATGYNEIVAHGALNTYRRLTLAHRGVKADAAHRMIGTTAAVGGQSIAALSKGASPNLYNRLPSLLAQAHAAATAAGGDYLVPALLWLQGESNQTTDKATYLAALRQFFADFTADAIAETGQEDPPAFFLYQTAAPNGNFDGTSLGVQMAQLEAALNDDNVFMVGPNFPYPDSNNLHLVANGYRWLGSQFGKVMFRVLTMGQRWKPLHIRRATLRGREILVDFHVPAPPLVFEDPWLQSGWFIGETATGGANTQYAVPNKGFTVRTTGGSDLTVTNVALASATQVMITLDATPAALPNLFYANGLQSHFGHGCVRDSDATLADDIYLDGQPGQVAGETNAALSGKRYPLPNWAVAQFLAVES